MYLKYRNYTHQLAEAALSIQRQVQRPNGYAVSEVETWNISGKLLADTQAELTAMIRALNTAYSMDGGDAVLLLPDGTTESAHKLTSAGSVGGVRILSRPSFPEGAGIEYVNQRTYSFVLEVERPLPDASPVMGFSQQIAYGGGGPRWLHQQPVTGKPIRQQTAQYTPYFCDQSGNSVGYLAPIDPPKPLYPDDEHRDRRRIVYLSPTRVGSGGQFQNMGYGVQWSYSFERSEPFV